jgi:hypothetical protein
MQGGGGGSKAGEEELTLAKVMAGLKVCCAGGAEAMVKGPSSSGGM